MALTFDDLPAAGALPLREAERTNLRVIEALKRRKVAAAIFVNEDTGVKLGAAYERIVRAWFRDGHELGNHTASHPDLNRISAEAFENELMRGEATLRKLVTPRYLRFPFNHTGDTREKMAAVEAVLKKRGYEVAACTIDTTDYEFARVYEAMHQRRDHVGMQRLRKAYLDFSGAAIDHYVRLNKQVLGETAPHVMLLHLNRLNADVMRELLDLFVSRGFGFVSLKAAQAHEAYRIPISSPSRFGLMWGYRWARERGVAVDGKLEPEPPAWVLEYGRGRKVTLTGQDGVSVQALIFGDGPRGVVLAHGGRFNKESWRPQAEALASKGFQVLAFDFRSDDATRYLDILAAVKHLRQSGTESVAVVGASMGGDHAAKACEAEPASISRLVLLAAGAYTTLSRCEAKKLFVMARYDVIGDNQPRLPAIRARYERASGPKRFVTLNGSAHAQAIFGSNEGSRLMRELLKFMGGA